VTSALDRLEFSRLCQVKFGLLSVKEFRSDSPLSTRKEDSCKGSPRCDLVALRCRVTPAADSVLEFQPDSLSRRSPLRKKQAFSNPFGTCLGATHSRRIALHAKPFSTSVYKGLTCIVATSTKICTRDRSSSPHGGPSARDPHALLLTRPSFVKQGRVATYK
jgi:hypothetical protein